MSLSEALSNAPLAVVWVATRYGGVKLTTIPRLTLKVDEQKTNTLPQYQCSLKLKNAIMQKH
eukprot:3572103-Amphidinium_carterae.1